MNAVGSVSTEVGDSDKMVLRREEADSRSEDLTRPREGEDRLQLENVVKT